MTDMLTIEERLNRQLNEKDREIDSLRKTSEELKTQLRGAELGWTLHQKLDKDQVLPIPRLELVYEYDGYEGREWSEYIVYYRLVYRHLIGDIMAVPLGQTNIKSSSGNIPIRDGKIDLPFRDGCHMLNEMDQLKLPGFAICGDVIQPVAAK